MCHTDLRFMAEQYWNVRKLPQLRHAVNFLQAIKAEGESVVLEEAIENECSPVAQGMGCQGNVSHHVGRWVFAKDGFDCTNS